MLSAGQFIWFIHAPAETRTFSRDVTEELRKRVLNAIAEQLGVPRETVANNPSILSDIGADSLDTVELVMELEEEFNIFDD